MKNAKEYFNILSNIAKEIVASGKNGQVYDFYELISMSVDRLVKCAKSQNKIFFIGNGASASISSHMAVDFSKNTNIRSMAFNDSVLLTCISNDFGYENVFTKSIEIYADKNDMIVAISSSGASENILNAVEFANSKGCSIITLSGFEKDNALKGKGEFNFYVPYRSYGIVEIAHHAICHCILDNVVKKLNRKG